MKLGTIEQAVRAAVGISALVGAAGVYAGILSASRRDKGRTVGRVLDFQRGSLAQLLPLSFLSAAVLCRLWRPLPITPSRPARVAAIAVGTPMYVVGLALMVWGRLALGDMYNVSSGIGVELFADHRLVTTGPFKYVRHPMYLGAQLAEVGVALLFRTWASLLIVMGGPVLVLRARKEDEALAAEFGQDWQDYRRRVPGWIPRAGWA